MNEVPYKTYLSESELPAAWYNLRADMKKKPAPLLNPGTLKPVTAEELEHVFCKELVRQELDDATPEALAEIAELAERPRCAAIGEIGLDYYWDASHREEQKLLFRRQLALALEAALEEEQSA